MQINIQKPQEQVRGCGDRQNSYTHKNQPPNHHYVIDSSSDVTNTKSFTEWVGGDWGGGMCAGVSRPPTAARVLTLTSLHHMLDFSHIC